MKAMLKVIVSTLVLTGCVRAQSKHSCNTAKIDPPVLQTQFRVACNEVSDIKSQLSRCQGQQNVNEKKLQKIENLLTQLRTDFQDSQNSAENKRSKEKLAFLEKKIEQHEEVYEAIVDELHQIRTHNDEVAATITQTQRQWQEVAMSNDITHANLEAQVRDLKVGLKNLASALREEKTHEHIAATSPAETVQPEVYVVKMGDSLGRVASRCNITVDQLRALNDLESDTLHVGQKLRLTAATPATDK